MPKNSLRHSWNVCQWVCMSWRRTKMWTDSDNGQIDNNQGGVKTKRMYIRHTWVCRSTATAKSGIGGSTKIIIAQSFAAAAIILDWLTRLRSPQVTEPQHEHTQRKVRDQSKFWKKPIRCEKNGDNSNGGGNKRGSHEWINYDEKERKDNKTTTVGQNQ